MTVRQRTPWAVLSSCGRYGFPARAVQFPLGEVGRMGRALVQDCEFQLLPGVARSDVLRAVPVESHDIQDEDALDARIGLGDQARFDGRILSGLNNACV